VRLQEEYYVLGTPDGWFSVAVQLSGRAIDGLRGQVFGDEVASFVVYVARGRPLFLP
jgi:putative lipase involved disintegration of autophagic bodies